MINWSAHRKAVESMYEDTLSLLKQGWTFNPEKKRQEASWIADEEIKDIPCHLDMKQTVTSDAGGVARQDMASRILTSPDINIPAGSRLLVNTKTGESLLFANSSPSAVKPSHQLIQVDLLPEEA